MGGVNKVIFRPNFNYPTIIYLGYKWNDLVFIVMTVVLRKNRLYILNITLYLAIHMHIILLLLLLLLLA